MCPPPFAPKPQLQHPLTPPNTCLPLGCLKPQTQKLVMAVHIPWYRFVGDSSGTIVITHFFQGKLLSVGKLNVTNYKLLQNKALGSVKICEELQGRLAGVPQPLPGCAGLAESHLWLVYPFVSTILPSHGKYCLVGQHFGASGGGISENSSVYCLWIAAVRKCCDPRSLLCHCLGRMLENCWRGSGPWELLVLSWWQWERAGELQALLRQGMMRQWQALQQQGHSIAQRLS